jgi:hypothetical protein
LYHSEAPCFFQLEIAPIEALGSKKESAACDLLFDVKQPVLILIIECEINHQKQ